jgi:sugar lactone lactonase YvrE
MTPRTFALGAVLAALLPVGGSTTGGMRALAPVEVFADRLDDPRGLAIDSDDNVFVAERASGTVLRLTRDGGRTIVARGLKHPFGLAVDAEARVIVSEEGAGRVLRLGPAKPHVIAAGLRRPRWLAVGDTDTIYVVVQSSIDDEPEDELDAIVAIRPDGGVSTVVDGLLGVAGIVTSARELYVLLRGADDLLAVRRYALAPDGPPDVLVLSPAATELRRGAGLARDRLGALWLSVQDATIGGVRLHDVVVKLSSSRTAVFAQSLEEPRDLAFSLDGDLYVIDARADRILRFRPPPPPTVDAVPQAVSSTALPLRGVATPDARIDVFVNDAENAATTISGTDGSFTTVVVIAQSMESRLEAFTTAARGDGLSSTPAVVSVTHDGDEPDLVFVHPPAMAFVRTDVAVEVQAGDGGSGIAQLTLEAGGHPLQPTLAPPLPSAASRAMAAWDTTGASDGTATLTARAVDGAGNERVVARVVVVDNTAPDVAIVEGPGGEIPDTVATFRFAGADNLTPPASLVFAWRVDGEEFGAFTAATAATTAPLASGPHRFEVKARDPGGRPPIVVDVARHQRAARSHERPADDRDRRRHRDTALQRPARA